MARDQSDHVQVAQRALCELLTQHAGIELVATLTANDDAYEDIDAEVAFVVGGDGAILRACRWFGTTQIPILGVNLGRLGFLADLSQEALPEILDELANRKFEVISHLMFECHHRKALGGSECYLGLNETALLSAASLSLIDVELAINGDPVTTYSGDGLIISTPVGSTAHNLSAGGPILRQDLRAFVVTPICPHTLTVRPIVDRADAEYQITAPSVPEGVMLVIDGQIKVPFESGDVVTIRQANVSFQLVRVEGHRFYHTLHRKLGWDGQPRYQRGRIERGTADD
ncbi:NAD(+)/NADH kinase [Thalassoglobus polymorphus]|uniref:NAD(+)/NADH kinase n=1 Tax=Thalassoglobus polymorphus TaxID=2527994 RepID=UPI001E5242B0|nr:NAD(+)/NADH kinase [Thalassoglobus polymorphus]